MTQEMTFENAAEAVTKLSSRPNNDNLLKLYAFYKQATDGDVKGKRPGMIDFKGRAKFDAWKALENMDSQESKQKYIDLVNELIAQD